MRVIDGIHHFPKQSRKVALTIGKFDGVHLGHQTLLSETVLCAEKVGGCPVVLTFHPHPATVLHPSHDHRQLMDFADLQTRLQTRGIQALILEPFNEEVAGLSAEEFLERLGENIPLSHLVVGENFRFGSGAGGDGSTLKEWGRLRGVEVVQVPSLIREGLCVSSTTIKEFLRNGKFSPARDFLGRNYYIRGEVLRGEGRGKTLNIPTANFVPTVNPPLQLGVYAGWAKVDHLRYQALLNIGRKPTFWRDQSYPLTYECHILDFNKDIYGQMLSFEPVSLLRGETKFDSAEELLAQIQVDIETARKKLQ